MLQFLFNAVLLFFGMLLSKLVFTSIFKPSVPVNRAFSYIAGLAIGVWFYVSWAKTGMDPIQLYICSAFQEADHCQRSDGQRRQHLNPHAGSRSEPSSETPQGGPSSPLNGLLPREVGPHLSTSPYRTVLFQDFSEGLGDFSSIGKGGIRVQGNGATFECFAAATSRGRESIGGTEITVEFKMVGSGHPYVNGAVLRDTVVALVDDKNGSRIQVGDTNYRNDGMYVVGTGDFLTHQSGNARSVGIMQEYRLTIRGASLKFERGDSVADLKEVIRRELPASIVGRRFSLMIGTGGPDYCPSIFRWVAVKVA